MKFLTDLWNILMGTTPLKYDNMVLTFTDDFNGKKLNTNKWMTHYYWGNSHSNLEHQFYSAEAFKLENSTLTINVENKQIRGWAMKDGKRMKKTFDVTSGLIHSGEAFKQKYGRFEIHCKVPLTKGYMPSFWLINPTSYPPEIDIMDFSEMDNKNLYVGYCFGDDESDKHFYRIKKKISNINLNGWNTYTLDWTPKRLTWYVNGRRIYMIKNVGIPQTPMYIAINLAIGDIDKKLPPSKKMLIDWVRVYKFSN